MIENKYSNDNEKRPILKIKDRIIGILVFAVPLIIIITYGVIELRENEAEYKKKNECVEKNCHEQRVKGEIYCSYHLWYATNSLKKREQDLADRNKKVYEARKDAKGYTDSGVTGSGKRKSNSKKYKMNDPMDYDTPEDYADDAWGVDFEDWDDAYNYWEDIMG